MTSTYSTNLKLTLMGTGDQSGTWGDTTNTNLGTLVEEAIAGYTTQALVSTGPTALTIPDGASSVGRNYVIEFTGTPTAGHTVTVPAVDKPYILFNNTNIALIVKVSGQLGFTIAAGKKAIAYTNSTDLIEVANAPVTEAGTQTLTNKTLTSPTITSAGVALNGSTSGSITLVATAVAGTNTLTLPAATDTVVGIAATQTLTNKTLTSPVLTAPALGTPASGTLTNATGLPISTGVSGLGSGVATFLATPTYTNLSTAVTGDTVVGIAATQTLTNKRVTPRVSASTANSATPTLNTDNFDMMVITAQSVAITSFTTNLTGTPTNGQKLIISITGTAAIALTFGSSFESSNTALPTTTVTTNRLDIGFIWNATTSKWRCVATA